MKATFPSLMFGAAIALSALCGPLFGQNSFDPTGAAAEASLPRQVRTQIEYIEMSLEQMTTLMEDEDATKNDTILRQRIAELIKKEKAEIIETQMVITRSGEKSTAESIREFIYPTEYEPPELPTTVKISGEAKDIISKKDLATPPTPTAFETRNLGATLEVEPTIGVDNQYIELRLAPEIVYHTENTKWATWKDKHGEADIQMPIFYTLRVNTAASLANKKPCLLAALSPKDDKGVTDFSRKVLIFAKCDIIFVGR